MNFVRRTSACEHLPIEGQATYGISNLHTKDTGLRFSVFISQKDDARHAARIEWSPMPRVRTSELGSYSVEPFEHRAEKRLPQSEELMLQSWVDLNKGVLLAYGDGHIEYTRDALEQLKPIGG